MQRGQIYFADLGRQQGSVQGGYRPVLILQNNRGNLHSPTVIIAPISSRKKSNLPTHVVLPETAGLPKRSTVMLEQIQTIDKDRLEMCVSTKDGRFQRYHKLDKATMDKVHRALSISIGLDEPYQQAKEWTLPCKDAALHSASK